MKKTMRSALFLFAIFALLAPACSVGPDTVGVGDDDSAARATASTIRVGAFNIQIFGTSKVGKANVLTVLAKIASTYDVMAIEEVGSNGSTATDATCKTVMDTYLAKIKSVSGVSTWSYVRGNQYAIVYRSDKVTCNGSAVYSGTKTFAYPPLLANFKVKTGTFDWSMVVIHTSPSLATTEIPALTTVMTETKTKYSESDVMSLGDFNADGSYYTEGTSGGALNGFATTSYTTVIKNGVDTTVATSVNTYDRIQLTSSFSTDYTGTSGIIKFGSVYDVTACEGTTTTAGTEAAVSDHYPVYALFNTAADTD